MKNKVSREAIKEQDKVFLITESIEDKGTDNRKITETKTIETEVTNEILDEYMVDREEQYKGFKKQESDHHKEIKKIETDIKPFVNTREYKTYKKNYDQFEIFEKFIVDKIDVKTLFKGDGLKEFEKYEKKRDSYKNFYVTVQQEIRLEMLKENLKAFDDIWEEDQMFIDQINAARKLL